MKEYRDEIHEPTHRLEDIADIHVTEKSASPKRRKTTKGGTSKSKIEKKAKKIAENIMDRLEHYPEKMDDFADTTKMKRHSRKK